MAMARAATTLLLALAALPAMLFTAGDACDNVPSMGIDEACDKACSTTTQPLVQLCQTTLRGAVTVPAAEATVYALAAAKSARSSYEASQATADRLLQNPSLPGDEKAAYDACKDKYEQASSLITGVINQLTQCSFPYVRQEYIDASVAVTSCGNGLAAFRSSPLYDMNAADQNSTMLAYDLGALIVGK